MDEPANEQLFLTFFLTLIPAPILKRPKNAMFLCKITFGNLKLIPLLCFINHREMTRTY